MKRLGSILALLVLVSSTPAVAWDAITLSTLTFDTVCGAKVDSGSGSSSSCTGKDDKDRDGYVSTVDVDDTDRDLFPGVYRTCGTDGYQVAQSDGTWASCTENATTPLCEATGSGTCYYVDPDSGSDANDGSYSTPFETLDKLKYYLDSGDRPAGWVGLTAGDVVYLFTDTDQSTYGVYYNNASFGDNILQFRGFDGTAANPIIIRNYPGQSVVFNPTYAGADERSIFYILQSDYFHVYGIEISGAGGHRGNGISVVESTGNIVEGVYVHDGKLNTSNGSAGAVKFQDCESCYLNNSITTNWYDDDYTSPSSGAPDNSVIVRVFRGVVEVNNNIIGNDVATSDVNAGACVQQKHGGTGDAITVQENVIFGCPNYEGINVSGPATVTKNYVAGVYRCWGAENVGGTTLNDNQDFTYNTCVDFTIGMNFQPDNFYNAIGDVTNKFNVFETAKTSTTMVHQSGDSMGAGTFDSDSNCFYNSAESLSFSGYGTGYTFSTWKSTYGQDNNSVNIDPALDSVNEAQGTGCTTWGWRLSSSGTPTPTPTPTPTATPTPTPTPAPASQIAAPPFFGGF